MSTMLSELGIPVLTGYRPENLEPVPDMVVVGNVIPRGNAELEEVLDRGIPYTSAAATIKEELLRGRHSVVVAGTHGKTTTTTLVSWVLDSAGLNPGFLIGGVAENFGTSFRWTDAPTFCIEGDEYDTAYFDKGPKFMHYLPMTAIVNNVEFDHADIYRDLDAVKLAFRRFVNLIPRTGTLVAGWDSAAVRELLPRALCATETFGIDEGAKWRASLVEIGAQGMRFRVAVDGVAFGEYATPIVGDFNMPQLSRGNRDRRGLRRGSSDRPRCARDVRERSATNAGPRGGPRRPRHRRLRPSSDRRPRDARGASSALRYGPIDRCLRAALADVTAARVPTPVRGSVRRGRYRDRGRVVRARTLFDRGAIGS